MFVLYPKSKVSTWRPQGQHYKCPFRHLAAHDATPALLRAAVKWDVSDSRLYPNFKVLQYWVALLRMLSAEVWLSWINKWSTQWHFCYYVTPCLQFIHPQISSEITIVCILGTASTEAKGFGAQECKFLFAGQVYCPDIKQPPKGYANNIHIIFRFNCQQFIFQVNQVLKAKHSISDLHIWNKAVYNRAN